MQCVWALIAVAAAGAVAAPGPDCNPALLHELPPRMRDLCTAINQLSYALIASYEDSNNYQQMNQKESSGLFEPGMKREDKIRAHEFLRFGRSI